MKTAQKRKPEVVVFEEPARKQRKEFSKQKKVGNISNDVRSVNFKEIAQEVHELGVSGFKKKDQRRYRQEKALALGAKVPKKEKMPYPLLMELKKIRNEKEKKRQEMESAMGIFTKKKKSKDRSIIKGRSGRWIDRTKGLDGSKQKKGIRRLKQKDIATFKKSRT